MSIGMPTKRISEKLHFPSGDEAHVWTVWFSQWEPHISVFELLLSTEENERAGRYVRREDRNRFVVAHGILRQLLGRYLSVEPQGLAFSLNAFGKPALIRGVGQPTLSFNLSHSGDVILYAMTAGRRVGVDIEAIRPSLDPMEIAQGQFSEREFKALLDREGAERIEAFFRCWTRKEAYLKARGEGLGYPLRNFSVSIGCDEPPQVTWAADDPDVGARWAVLPIAEIPGYAGAVVCEGGDTRFVSRRLVTAD